MSVYRGTTLQRSHSIKLLDSKLLTLRFSRNQIWPVFICFAAMWRDDARFQYAEVAVSTLHSAAPGHAGTGARPIFLIISLKTSNAIAAKVPLLIERWKHHAFYTGMSVAVIATVYRGFDARN